MKAARAKPWKRYLDERFGELPDSVAEDLDDLSAEESGHYCRRMEALAEAMAPFEEVMPDITVEQFARLSMAGVTPKLLCVVRAVLKE